MDLFPREAAEPVPPFLDEFSTRKSSGRDPVKTERLRFRKFLEDWSSGQSYRKDRLPFLRKLPDGLDYEGRWVPDGRQYAAVIEEYLQMGAGTGGRAPGLAALDSVGPEKSRLDILLEEVDRKLRRAPPKDQRFARKDILGYLRNTIDPSGNRGTLRLYPSRGSESRGRLFDAQISDLQKHYDRVAPLQDEYYSDLRGMDAPWDKVRPRDTLKAAQKAAREGRIARTGILGNAASIQEDVMVLNHPELNPRRHKELLQDRIKRLGRDANRLGNKRPFFDLKTPEDVKVLRALILRDKRQGIESSRKAIDYETLEELVDRRTLRELRFYGMGEDLSRRGTFGVTKNEPGTGFIRGDTEDLRTFPRAEARANRAVAGGALERSVGMHSNLRKDTRLLRTLAMSGGTHMSNVGRGGLSGLNAEGLSRTYDTAEAAADMLLRDYGDEGFFELLPGDPLAGTASRGSSGQVVLSERLVGSEVRTPWGRKTYDPETLMKLTKVYDTVDQAQLRSGSLMDLVDFGMSGFSEDQKVRFLQAVKKRAGAGASPAKMERAGRALLADMAEDLHGLLSSPALADEVGEKAALAGGKAWKALKFIVRAL